MPVVKFLCCDDNYRNAVETVPASFKVLSCKSLEELKKVREIPRKTPDGNEPCISAGVVFHEHPSRFLAVLIFSASSFSVHHKASDNLVTVILFRHLNRDRQTDRRTTPVKFKSMFFGDSLCF